MSIKKVGILMQYDICVQLKSICLKCSNKVEAAETVF